MSIFGHFTRSYDESHKQSNRIHLIGSIVLFNSILNIDELDNNLFRGFLSGDERIFLFIVLEKSYFLERNINVYDEIAEERRNMVIIYITLEGLLGISNSKENIIENIFGVKSLWSKNFDLIGRNSYFLFLDLYWSNILLKFKLSGIDISGGTSPKRHLLNTADGKLTQFLNICLNFNYNEVNNIIYKSFNDKNQYLSSLIPLDYYNALKQFLDGWCENKGLNVKANDIASSIERLVLNNDNSHFNENLIFGVNNLLYSINHLMKIILKNENDKLEELKKKLNKLELDINQENYRLNRNENLTIDIHMSNKDKKRLKKERTEILKDPSINKKLKNNIDKYTINSTKLKGLITDKENEIKNLEISLKYKSLNDLNEIYSKSKISTKSKFSGFKLKKNANLITNNVVP